MSIVFASFTYCRKVFVLLFALCCICGIDFCAAAIVPIDDLISIDNIEVKHGAENSIAAKRGALEKALHYAFCVLVKDKFEISDNLNDIPENEINKCLYDYSVNNEKYSDSFYIASLSYRFDRNNVLNLLKKYNIKCSVTEDIKEINPGKNIKVVIYTYDFINNYNALKNIDYTVKKFSGKIVVLLMKSHAVCDLEKLGIKYANI